MTRVIGIVGGKGGVGKTTIAINLACALGLLQKRASLIDFNFTTAHLAIELGVIPDKTLNSVLRNEDRIGDVLYPCFNTHIIPASLNLSELNNMEFTNLKPKIKELLNDFEIVLLDSAPGFGKEALSSIQASDDLIFVVNPTMTSIIDVLKCKQLAFQLGVKPLGIVINKVRNKKFELKPDEICNLIQLPLLGVVHEDEDFLKSEASRVPLVHYNRNKGEKFLEIASSLIGNPYKKPTFLQRMLIRISPTTR